MDSDQAGDIPRGATYPILLRKLAEEKPDKPAYIFFDTKLNRIELTRKDVWDCSRKYAAILKRRGVQKGDIVCNTLVNSPERLLSALGSVVAGAISMHGQVFLADGEDLIHNCKVTKCSTIIVDPGQEKGAWTILKRIQYTDDQTGEIRFAGLPDLIRVLHFRVCSSKDEERGLHDLRLESEMFEEEGISEEDLAFIFSTSGTTGFSKQFPHSHRNCLIIGTLMTPIGYQKKENEMFFTLNSFGWIGGYPSIYLTTGCTRVLVDLAHGLPERVDHLTREILNEVEIDYAFMTVLLVESLARLVSSGHSIKKRCHFIVTGGTMVSKRILNAIGVITDVIGNCYGLTEWTGYSVFWADKGSTYEDYCVGIPSKEWTFKILDDDFQELPQGKIGQVAIEGPLEISSYLNQPEKTKSLFSKDGALIPGDLGYQDEKGNTYVLGRAKDAIHRGSYIHYPGWLEARIRKFQGVENAAVVGVPDPTYHEEICACIIPSKGDKPTTQQLEDYCNSLFLSDPLDEMTVKIKHFLFMDSFPRNSNDKLDRKVLRDQVYHLLGVKDRVYST